MRRAQKEQAENLISLLDQAHEEIRKAVRDGQEKMASDLLSQCQEGAISLGDLIEKTEGEGFSTIALLEDYCELVYQIHQAVMQGGSADINKGYKNLRKCLIKIENSVRSDIRVRREVVFLPYKASMWDSLESIWKAAGEDPDCDAYVIPIPYYDKNPDGSFRELHYEGGEYPDYVPVIWYQDYDFQARRPDMIYIHNPYDDCNYVTSVHPSFYSSVLKQYTNCLVYIPYFILGEPDPDQEETLENLEHFVTLPGVYNADKVVVQSEAMRKVYIKILTKEAGEHTKNLWREKVLGLGSPKYDKVAETDRKNLMIPDDWRKIIEKPDGSRKKIVFYNTSVVALLEHNEKMLEKMRYVFGVFRENQEEVALLWRPHPLVKATIESMRPALWGEYDKLLRQYKKEGWGIYDNTADLDRAIKISDAYYGDASSVVQLYEKTGKPVMMQSPFILKAERYKYDMAATEAVCSWKGNYYFVYIDYPLLCKIDKSTFACEILYQFEENYSRLYRSIVPYQNKLYFIPFLSDKIAVYDMESQEMRFFPLNEDYVDVRCQEALISSKFEDVLVDDDILYMIPHSYHAIIKMNMDTLGIEEIPLGKRGVKAFCYCLGTSCMAENEIVFPVYSEGSVCVFNTVTNVVSRIYLSENKKKYSNAFLIEDKIWMIPEKIYEGIDIWDKKTGEIEKNIVFSGQINTLSRNNSTMDFRLGFFDERNLYLIAFGMESSIYINLDTKTAGIWNLSEQYKREEMNIGLFCLRHAAILSENEKVMVCNLDGEWVIFDGNELHSMEKQSIWDRQLIQKFAREEKVLNMQEESMSLYNFLKMENRDQDINSKGNSGKVIYKCISG